jgi:aldose 1-epimerase
MPPAPGGEASSAGMSDTSLELRAGALRLLLRPDLGGSIAGLWRDGLPVLRSRDDAALAKPREAASFPLVPYSNRLGYRRFRWHGHDYTTAPNFDGNAMHSLHGVAWRRRWQVESVGATEAALRYQHEPDADWPFAFSVDQRVVLDADALTLHLVVRNNSAAPQPIGLGWHPYFPKRSRSRLHVECTERWDSDPTGLPTRRVAQPGIDADVAHLSFDNCFEGWRGAVRIRDEKLSLKLSSSLPYLVVYTPPQHDYFCVEPVSHVNNAIHMADPLAHGLRSLAPQSSFDAWMKLEISAV